MTGGKQEEGGCLVSVTNLLIIIKFYDQRPLLSGVIYFKVNENQDVMEKDTKKIYDHFTNPISTLPYHSQKSNQLPNQAVPYILLVMHFRKILELTTERRPF